MVKRYVRIAMWKETHDAFRKRCDVLNNDLKEMGIRKRIPFTKFLNAVAKRRATTDNMGEMIR
jgi:hypothetical protein